MSENPTVGVVVLNWNGADDTCRCIRSIRESKYSKLRTIVVDNGSREGQVSKIRNEHGDFIDTLIENGENLGYAAGNNVGIRHALSEYDCSYVLILNNDTVLEADAISELVQGAEQRDAGIVGPKIQSLQEESIISTAGGKIYSLLGQHKMRGKGEKDEGQYDVPSEVDFVSGACMLIRKEVFEAIGLIPTFYFLQWEDIDFCTEAEKRGFKVLYWPQSLVYHEVNASFEREAKVYPMVTRGFRNRLWYFRRHSTRREKLILLFTLPMITLPIHLFYYIIVRRDIQYIMQFLKGIYWGSTKNIGEGPDPDPELRDVAEKAKHIPTDVLE
ncbi:MAG: glycosyltransferase family 2 protein [Halobacteriaceae archaeon]